MRHLLLSLLLVACARRVEPVTTPAPTCASRYDVRHGVENGVLAVNAAYSAPCSARPLSDLEFTRERVESEQTCPRAGEVVLEVGTTETPFPAEYAATLDERSKAELTRTLRNFLSRNMTSAKALVVRCSKPRWLLIATRRAPPSPDQEPIVMPYEMAPLETATPEPVPPPEQLLKTGACDEALDVGEQVWVGRRLGTGLMPGPSHFEQWRLGRTGTRARLIIQEFEARRGPLEDLQPQGTFTCRSSTAWEGTVTGASPLRFELSQPPNGPTRSLVCTQRTVGLAGERARRVRIPSRMEGCNASRWAPGATQSRRILDCLQGSESHFYLGSLPGIEQVTFDGDDCGDLTRSLRGLPADGGVAPAVKLSEQPADFVPAHLRR